MPSIRKTKRKAPPTYFMRRGRTYIGRVLMVALALLLVTAMGRVSVLLRDLSGEMALSDAKDAAMDTVNEAVLLMMSRGTYDYDYFVDIGVGEGGDPLQQPDGTRALISRIKRSYPHPSLSFRVIIMVSMQYCTTTD